MILFWCKDKAFTKRLRINGNDYLSILLLQISWANKKTGLTHKYRINVYLEISPLLYY